jgi:hypothetical protein
LTFHAMSFSPVRQSLVAVGTRRMTPVLDTTQALSVVVGEVTAP